jgi:hypothetical protein
VLPASTLHHLIQLRGIQGHSCIVHVSQPSISLLETCTSAHPWWKGNQASSSNCNAAALQPKQARVVTYCLASHEGAMPRDNHCPNTPTNSYVTLHRAAIKHTCKNQPDYLSQGPHLVNQRCLVIACRPQRLFAKDGVACQFVYSAKHARRL